MEKAISALVKAGGRDQLLEDFRALADTTTSDGSPRFSERPTLAWLARFLTGSTGGPNKDLPLFELCHLVKALAHSDAGPTFHNQFFLDGEKVSPRRLKTQLTPLNFSTGVRGHNDGLTLSYPEGEFSIRYGRMPMLVALHEFLASMESFAFYTDLTEIFDELGNAPFTTKSTQAASNRISSHLRQYRKKHLTTAEHDNKFHTLLSFLQERNSEKEINIDDEAILDFWRFHSQGKEFKGYRTVFELFTTFMTALEEIKDRQSAHGATRLGTDWEGGELDISLDDARQEDMGDWQSPLALFDEEPVASVKFFKKTGERKPLEALTRFGPKAATLPLAFLRYECFGQVQAGITNDLQVGRGTVQKRLSCDQAESYQARQTLFLNLLDHVKELQKAALHVLTAPKPEGNVIAFPRLDQGDESSLASAREESAKAFKRLTRKGFEDDAFLDPNKEKAFRLAAGALISIGTQLETFLSKAGSHIDRFDEDKTVFSTQFKILYGEQS